METIQIKSYIHAPVERVWEVFGVHENYTILTGVKSARILRPGYNERNGVGSIREIRADWGIKFIEEIVVCKPPWRVEYIVRKCTIPLRHELGRIDLIPRGDGTEIHWQSRFRIPAPLFGRCLSRFVRFAAQQKFNEAVLGAKSYLENEMEKG